MTSTTASTASLLLDRAAAAAVRTLPVAEPMTMSALDPDTVALAGLSAAVVVAFTGTPSGEFAVLVDQAVLASLPPMAVAADDLPAALVTVTDAITGSLGAVVSGAGQRVDPRLAVQRCAARAEHAAVAFQTASGVRAIVLIGVDAARTGATRPAASAERLDLLRGVEMQASAELGRARMTIADLLSLHTGAVIELDRLAGDPADLYVNGRLIARGEVVVVDENYAIRVTQIVDAETER